MLVNENDLKLAKSLAKEVVQDLNHRIVYELACEALSRRFVRKNNIQSLIAEYSKNYSYVFLEHGIDLTKNQND